MNAFKILLVATSALALSACTDESALMGGDSTAPSSTSTAVEAGSAGEVVNGVMVGAPKISDSAQGRAVSFDEIRNKAKAILSTVQAKSHQKELEYCGFIGVAADGSLKAAYATRGRHSSCGARGPRSWRIVASYHTHGAYDGVSASEWPSLQDVRGDMRRGIHGFISTPGGRFWHVNPANGFSNMIGGEGFFVKDSKHQDDAIVPKKTYTLRELRRFYTGA